MVGRFCTHPWHVQPPKQTAHQSPASHLAPQKYVRRDVECRDHREVLVDRLDAGGAGIAGVVKMHHPTVHLDLARIGNQRARQRFDQRRLARPVIANHSQYLGGKQLEVGTVDRRHVAVLLDQAVGLEHGRGHWVLLRANWSTVTATITRIPVAMFW